MKKKYKKRFKLNFFNAWLLISSGLCVYLLGHDFLFWGVIPMIKGEFYQLTYFGMFLDLTAIAMLEMNLQLMKEW